MLLGRKGSDDVRINAGRQEHSYWNIGHQVVLYRILQQAAQLARAKGLRE
jgi:hypothetical protein